MADVPPSVAIVGAMAGWITAIAGWTTAAYAVLKDRRTWKENENKILREVREKLDNDDVMLETVEILRAEAQGQPPPLNLASSEMRSLPALLEQIGSHWEFKAVSLKRAYDVVGEEVLLCDKSKLLWAGARMPRSQIYWRVFNNFAAAISDEDKRRASTTGTPVVKSGVQRGTAATHKAGNA